uniref:Uncharacterized protein n=1 Tax=Palpitomonas bilix TaxID=652834 RepID=A0A7S3DDD9_9EUKA|mmetsp:Transcript_32918/g.84993  ORF Transcript_32918/g.84993 Transcript_32918/m.84993 type:complete len:194 (+) Transcript_32918:181-762(+)|eukprot:CAMPEP_0113893232 /NCGR_PEP_ID=MMETSP0780_2-20120614/15954_1 /TAXON_ID=652834 /ORGANISM="Palpitomonas bilix" /LENGTH=193 /DNA_ID=CAMNT_0000883451 /DNA_START=111 /DNA_END=692 /DNA_ORIENTATION=+ /assembly_acc=CAM_ASM_000599
MRHELQSGRGIAKQVQEALKCNDNNCKAACRDTPFGKECTIRVPRSFFVEAVLEEKDCFALLQPNPQQKDGGRVLLLRKSLPHHLKFYEAVQEDMKPIEGHETSYLASGEKCSDAFNSCIETTANDPNKWSFEVSHAEKKDYYLSIRHFQCPWVFDSKKQQIEPLMTLTARLHTLNPFARIFPLYLPSSNASE